MMKPGKMLCEVLTHLFKKPFTVLYPFEKVEMPDKFRGKIKFYSDKCIGCKLCERDCPSFAVKINRIGEEKKFEAVFELDKCIYCGQCVDSCNKDALEYTKEFELAAFDRKNLKCKFEYEKSKSSQSAPAE